MKIRIDRATLKDVHDIAVMMGEYRSEMTALAGCHDFEFRINEEKRRLKDFLDNPDYAVFLARSVRGHPLGYLTVFESIPYPDDTDGILEQLYVRPFYRQRKIARRLFQEVCQFAGEKHWRRILVTLPGTLSPDPVNTFLEKQGFANSRQRKQWFLIEKAAKTKRAF